MKPNPAIVMPLDEHAGLDIVRSLGRRGIPVYGIDPDPHAVGGKSKYCQLVTCPDPKRSEAAYLEFLVDWGRKLGVRTVLFPLSDEMALFCSRERATLQAYYEYVMPDSATLINFTTKAGLASLAKQHGIPAPKAFIPSDAKEVEEIAQAASYPAILKPVEGAYWHVPQIASLLRENVLSGRAKVVLCHSPSELLKTYHKIAAYDDRMIIQEVVPGPDENLAYISFYLDRQSRPLALFAGRKLRVIPVGFGSASFVHSFRDPKLEDVALRLLCQAGYQGLGGLEFKLDTRDGCYKLIECNTRFGMWDGLAVRCGIDMPYIAYSDALGQPVESQAAYREGVIWVDWQRDVRAFWMYHKQGRLTLGQWLRSLRGEKMWAIY